MAYTLPDHFEGEDVIITFEKEYVDSTEDAGISKTNWIKNVEGKVLSWNIGGGSQPTEDIFAFGGKTFNIQKPREKFTISFDIMINNSDFDKVQFGGQAASRIGEMAGKIVKSTDSSRKWRVIFWFQDSGSHVSRTVAASNGNRAYKVIVPSQTKPLYRMIFCDVKSVTFEKEFAADEYLKGTLNLEFSATDEIGKPNYFEEEGTYTATTTQLGLKSLSTTASSGIMREAKGYLNWSATTTPNWYCSATTTVDTSIIYPNAS